MPQVGIIELAASGAHLRRALFFQALVLRWSYDRVDFPSMTKSVVAVRGRSVTSVFNASWMYSQNDSHIWKRRHFEKWSKQIQQMVEQRQ